MEVTRRRGRRCKKLLDDLKDKRGYSHLKEKALDRTMWRHRFGGGFGPVVRQNTERNVDTKMHLTLEVNVMIFITWIHIPDDPALQQQKLCGEIS